MDQAQVGRSLLEIRENDPLPRRNIFPYFAAITANLMTFISGVSFAWSSPYLPKLISSQNNPLGRPITSVETTWITASLPFGSIFGSLLVRYMVNSLGRKRSLLLLTCPMIVSWIIFGIVIGAVFIAVPMFLVEISENHNRGVLTSLMGFFNTSGFLFVNSLGPFVTIKTFAVLVCLALTIFFVVFYIWIPETPQFLAYKEKQNLLRKSLVKLRNKVSNDIDKETEELLTTAQNNKLINQNNLGFADLFKSKGLRKAITITVTLAVLQQASGFSAIIAYLQVIFNSSGNHIAPELASILVSLVQVCSTFLTLFVVDRLGRKILLLISLSGCCVAMISLGGYFYLQIHNYKIDAFFWLPIVSLFVFVVSFSVGLGPLLWTILAELFPPGIKSAAIALTSAVIFFVSFLVILFFSSVAKILGQAQSFWVFAGILFSGTIFVYRVLPETKGKSLQEIQKLLHNES